MASLKTSSEPRILKKTTSAASIRSIFPEINIQTREIHRNCRLGIGFIFWLFVLILSFGLCSLQIYLLVAKYYKYEFTLVAKDIDVTSLQYPDIFICPVNSFNYTKMHAEGLDNETIRYLLSPLSFSLVNTHREINQSAAEEKYLKWMSLRQELKNLEYLYGYFKVSATEYTKECWVAVSNVTCIKRPDQVVYLPWLSGICFILRPSDIIDDVTNQSIIQSVPGRFGSLKIVLQRPAEASKEMVGLLNEVDFQFYITNVSEGAKIEVGSFITSKLGKSSIVSVRRKEITKLGKPYGNCVTEEDGQVILGEYTNATFGLYTYEKCHIACEHAHASERCNNSCVLPGFFTLALLHSYAICESAKLMNCMHTHLTKANCSKCKSPCNYMKFDKVITTGDCLHPKQAIFEIYHESMTYSSLMDEEALSLEGMLGSIGGQLSLWLGFKVATILQICFYCSWWMCRSPCSVNAATTVKASSSKKIEESNPNNIETMMYDD